MAAIYSFSQPWSFLRIQREGRQPTDLAKVLLSWLESAGGRTERTVARYGRVRRGHCPLHLPLPQGLGDPKFFFLALSTLTLQ